MPRNYILKRPKAYTEDTVKAALRAIQDGMSVFKASKEFGVPFETLRGWHANLHSGEVLTEEVAVERLRQEEIDRAAKKKRGGKKFPAKKKSAVQKTKKKLFVEDLSNEDEVGTDNVNLWEEEQSGNSTSDDDFADLFTTDGFREDFALPTMTGSNGSGGSEEPREGPSNVEPVVPGPSGVVPKKKKSVEKWFVDVKGDDNDDDDVKKYHENVTYVIMLITKGRSSQVSLQR